MKTYFIKSLILADKGYYINSMVCQNEIFLILHNIRSLYNIGSIFRTADGAGVKKIFLTGYTSAPIDVFGKTRREIQKTALGAEKFVEWKRYKNIGELIKKLKKEKIFVVAVEQHPKSINFKEFRPKYPLALLFGNEVRGLSGPLLKKCNAIIEIPMRGRKESLNVAVAVGVVLFQLV